MKNKILVQIAGREYTLVTTDSQQQVERAAQQVDQLMVSVMKQTHVSAMDAAVLTALNAVDSANQQEQTVESLREQIQSNLAELTKVKQELADAKREIRRLKKAEKA